MDILKDLEKENYKTIKEVNHEFWFHVPLTHLTMTSFLWDKGKQNSPRWDTAKRGVPSGAILFADMIFIEK